MENCANEIIEADCDVYRRDYDRWTHPDYVGGQRDRWYTNLGETVGKTKDEVRGAYEAVEAAYEGKITITRVDNSRKIVVRDNGIGMSYNEMKEAVKKGKTIKRGFWYIGELGNGLTYLVSACDSFTLETSNGNEHSRVKIENMYSWITNPEAINDEPLSNPELVAGPAEPFTEVTVERTRTVDSDYPDLFDPVMTTKRFVHLIRTKTAVGALYDIMRFPVYNTLRSDSMEIEINDTFQGENRTEDVEFAYQSPAQIVRDLHAGAIPPILTLENARQRLADHTDIGGHSLESTGIFVSDTGVPLYYTSFLANRDWYLEASRAARLCDIPESEDVHEIGRSDVISGIELGVKGMPTGISVDPPLTGFQGYWGNFHIMILDNRLKFDEGRKTPVGRRVSLYRDCAKDVLFNKIETQVISAAIKDAVVALNLAQMMTTKTEFLNDRLRNRTNLGYAQVQVTHVPKYEQDVVMLFHEMIGAGILPYYKCLDASSLSTYDAIYNYKIPKAEIGIIAVRAEKSPDGNLDEKIIVEFKHRAERVIEDIAKNVKFYYMIDLLVCWDVNTDECTKARATLIPKPMEMVRYWGTTHELKLTPAHFMNVGSGRPLDVICLKELINRLNNGTYNVR